MRRVRCEHNARGGSTTRLLCFDKGNHSNLPFMIAFALFCAGCDEGSGTQPGREAMNVENPSIHIHAASHMPFDEIREAPLH